MKNISVFDLFAGPGGLGEGFCAYTDKEKHNPFNIVLSVEKDVYAHQTLTTRALFRKISKSSKKREVYNKYLRKEISRQELFAAFAVESKAANQETMFGPKELGRDNAEIHKRIKELANNQTGPKVLIGGPPCQAYSLAGRSRNAGKKDYVAREDNRHFLYKEYLSVLAILQPDVFIMENVRGILSSKVDDKLVFPEILNDLENPERAIKDYNGSNYKVFSLVTPFDLSRDELTPKDFLIKAENYGLPQARHRVILLGIKQPSSKIPRILLKTKAPVTVGAMIGDLPLLRSGLSKVNDTSGNWHESVSKILKNTSKLIRAQFPNADLSSLPTIPYENLKRAGTHSNYEKLSMPSDLQNWIRDDLLNYITNHESRGHIESDLLRYSYSAAYAMCSNGTSPKAKDFPASLAPAHKNWNSGTHSDRFRVQPSNKCATTITSHISKDGHYFIHYDPKQCRSLTVREAARLQTFPDNYFFEGNRTNQYVQVGNAVPPYLALQVAEIVEQLLT